MFRFAKYPGQAHRFPVMRLEFSLLLFCWLTTFSASARVSWLFQAGAGTAYGSVNSRIDKPENHYRVDISPRITPTAGLSVLIPLSQRLTLEPGLLYSRKGFRGIDEFVVHDGNYTSQVLFDTHYQLNYLTLPIQLNYTLLQCGQHKLLLGGGMNYAILLNGSNDYFTRQVWRGAAYEGWFRNNQVFKGLMQTKNTYEGTMSIFDAGLRLQVSYIFRSRLMLRVFHEQSLYSVYLKEPNNRPAVRLRYTGLSIGILFPSFKGVTAAAAGPGRS
ncbi:outer membrane beta-barrel protein [Taibaiella koreensis]|uniref:outer membrane beta-barrel protein n=1 Tax=Taibaiella koreensis TaxID=1268548 RepID=UPI000E59B397|nr:outer membrane beta-barrel protein [Taibaiella koreensis]